MLDLYKTNLSYFFKTYRRMARTIYKDISKEEKINEKIDEHQKIFLDRIEYADVEAVIKEYNILISQFQNLIEIDLEIEKLDLLFIDKLRINDKKEIELMRSISDSLEKAKKKIDTQTYKVLEQKVKELSSKIIQIHKEINKTLVDFVKQVSGQQENFQYQRSRVHGATPEYTASQYSRVLRSDFKRLDKEMGKLIDLEEADLKILKNINSEEDVKKAMEIIDKTKELLNKEMQDFNKTLKDLTEIFNFAAYKYFIVINKMQKTLGGDLEQLRKEGFPEEKEKELVESYKGLMTLIDKLNATVKNMERRIIQLSENE
jgi:hypothetical protein